MHERLCDASPAIKKGSSLLKTGCWLQQHLRKGSKRIVIDSQPGLVDGPKRNEKIDVPHPPDVIPGNPFV
jgi:hypothetical protein